MRFLFVWFVKITGWLPHVVAFRKRIYYEDKKAQSRHIKGSAIIMSNHHRLLDYPLIMYVFLSRTVRCLVAELMYKKNIFTTLTLKGLGAIKVDRYNHDFSFVAKSCDILKKGGVINIFPEAKLPDKDDLPLMPFKPSVAYIALLSGAPIIPIYINGLYFKLGKPSRVIIGTPIDVQGMYDNGLDQKENLDIITKKLKEKVEHLKDELERQTAQEG